MASGGSKSKQKANIQEINASMKNLAAAIKNLNADLTAMMKGNTETGGAFWNGNKASKFYKKAIGNLKNDIIDYNAAYKRLNSYGVTYEKAVAGDK